MKYPEHEKMKALGDRRAGVQEFIDWLYDQRGWWIAEPLEGRVIDHELVPVRDRREQIMAAFFEIDLLELEKEKRAMIDELRDLAGGEG